MTKQHLLPPHFFRILLTIALPIILQNLMQSLVNMLDTVMVGRLGSVAIAAVELLCLAVPRRVFTASQLKYAIDRIKWLYDNRELVGGLKFVEEPASLCFFFGRLAPTSD